MNNQLSPKLLQFLINEGFLWSLSKTRAIELEDASVEIVLTPVRTKPVLARLPEGYDTFFHNRVEPRHMAEGIDDAKIYVVINEDLLSKYQSQL